MIDKPDYIKKNARHYAYTASLEIVRAAVERYLAEDIHRLRELNHYTSLEVINKILDNDDVRMSHAEYSNDQAELKYAIRLIFSRIGGMPSHRYADLIRDEYKNKSDDLDAYVFCMSQGNSIKLSQQDVLSQWRAYGADGRGGCLTISPPELMKLAQNLVGLQLNPVIYEPSLQVTIIDSILNQGESNYRAGINNAIEATASALIALTPIMKTIGFEEEREWRLIFIPPPDIKVYFSFHPRRDFLAPYVNLKDLCTTYRQKLIDSDEYSEEQRGREDISKFNPLIPAIELMVGPSGHQDLNRRALAKIISQNGRGIRLTQSAIPYRSLA